MTVGPGHSAPGVGPDVREAVRAALAMARTGRIEGGAAADAAPLAATLYATWYAAAAPVPALVPDGRLDDPMPLPDDLAALARSAHAAAARWEDGWAVERTGPGGKVVAERRGERRVLYRADYVVPGRGGLAARVGDLVHACARRDLVDPDGAWWRTRGSAWSETTPPDGLLRLYWDVSVAGLPRLVHELTTLLDPLDAPWMLKCAADPAHHARPDAVVAYLVRADAAALVSGLEGVRSAIADMARDHRPPFTLPVGRGLAAAEDPGRSLSFGEHRCRLVAEGVVASLAENRQAARSVGDAESEAASAVAARFAAEGLDPRRPWAAGPQLLPWEVA
jgi:hypothetical protein